MNSLPANVAPSADSLMIAARSAPLNPGVARQSKQIDVRSELYLAAVDFQNFETTFDIRQRNVNLPIESTWTRERRIEHIDAVRRSADDHLIVRVEAVHFDEDRVERLLAFIVTTGAEARATSSADGIDFVQEDDAR